VRATRPSPTRSRSPTRRDAPVGGAAGGGLMRALFALTLAIIALGLVASFVVAALGQ